MHTHTKNNFYSSFRCFLTPFSTQNLDMRRSASTFNLETRGPWQTMMESLAQGKCHAASSYKPPGSSVTGDQVGIMRSRGHAYSVLNLVEAGCFKLV